MQPNITVFHNRFLDFIRKDASMEVWGNDYRFTEGPLWHPEGYYLFSDIPANCIYRISEKNARQVYLEKSGTGYPGDPDINQDQPGSNGLAFSVAGELLICQHGGHALARMEQGAAVPFVAAYKGKPFNSPNDLVVSSDGKVFFSDPPYGLKGGKLNPGKFQDRARVYCWKEGSVQVISERYEYPNGVCLSPGGKLLYICSSKPFENFISVHDAHTGAFLQQLAQETGDGIKCDRDGNLYLSTKEGILVLDPQGNRLGLISFPKVPANHCWGGREGRDLFVTAREEIYLIKDLYRK